MTPRTMSLALLLALALGVANALPQGRLLGSEDAKANEFPWVASLRLNNAHICSACIISETQMLTAAHCVSDVGTTPVPVRQLSARVGSINQFAGGELMEISQVVIHPSYGNFLHDVALLTLSKRLTFNEKVNKIALPVPPEEGSEGENVEQPPNGTPVYVAGWGEQLDGTSNFKLQKANFNTVSQPFCELAAGYGYKSTLCLSSGEKQGVCRGDAGSPVMNDEKQLVGVVSFPFGNCGTTYPDVSSRVLYYLDWIAANAQ